MSNGWYIDTNGVIRHTSESNPDGKVWVDSLSARVEIIGADDCVDETYVLWSSYSALLRAIKSS